MTKIWEMVLAAGLLVAASIAAAGPIRQGPAANNVADPECPGAAASMVKFLDGIGPDSPFIHGTVEDNITGGEDSIIEEYLSFHAQVTQENGKFSLMPWSGLRTHTN